MPSVTLQVNGELITRDVEPRAHLADFLRETLGLTGTHLGCEHGVCGACTLMVDGRPMRSCLTYAVTCADADIRTIESFADDPLMAALRRAFNTRHALQCGYCTPGMLATAYDIVARLPQADEKRVRAELAGNLCRCTGYAGIVAAILDVLAAGPHEAALRPMVRAPLSATAFAREGTPDRIAAQTVTLPIDGDAPLDGGVTLSRSLPVAVSAERLWNVLQDIPTVAACLPGAVLDEIREDGTVRGAFRVSVGPIEARFAGTARVAFDPPARRGTVRGSGGDTASRSRAAGLIQFAAMQNGEQAKLDLAMTYRIDGPLAQFGRPAVVADIVDRILARFASNIARAATGETVDETAPIGGVGLLLQALFGRLRALFGG